LQLRRNKQHGKSKKKTRRRKQRRRRLPLLLLRHSRTTLHQQEQAGADLSIADLKNLATIIDVASTRGAFRANEMATVGVMFNKLSAFLAKVAPVDKPAEQPGRSVALLLENRRL
jgi:hypothetical protein